MRNITTPAKAVSFEDALRNLAAKLTGKPAASLPRTQEAVVQYIADNISSVKELTDALAKELAIRLTQELAEAIVQEVMERLAPAGTEAAQDSRRVMIPPAPKRPPRAANASPTPTNSQKGRLNYA